MSRRSNGGVIGKYATLATSGVISASDAANLTRSGNFPGTTTPNPPLITVTSNTAVPTISSLIYTGTNFYTANPTLTAAQANVASAVRIVGTNFTTTTQVFINSNIVNRAYVSNTELRVTFTGGAVNTANSLMVFNSANIGTAYTPGIAWSSAPVWTAYSFNYPSGSSLIISSQLAASGAVSYILTSGSLPDGLTLSTAGLISGTLTSAATATYTFTVTAYNTYGFSSSQLITLSYYGILATAQILLVGGGGGGTNYGGGGAGGLVTGTVTMNPANTYTINVGTGGAGRLASSPTLNPGTPGFGCRGTASNISGAFGAGPATITALGGGGGGADGPGPNPFTGGGSGGGGGGAITCGWAGLQPSQNPGIAGITNYGRGGGPSATKTTAGGGGGGATANGNGSVSGGGGAGGAGYTWPITGTTYAGGGGGGNFCSGTGGTGGSGGGGTGGANGSTPGTPGTDGLGGGGGGAGGASGSIRSAGGTGGAGVVIVSYPALQQLFTGGTVSSPPAAPGYFVHTFTTPGSLVGTAYTVSYLVVAGGGGGGGGNAPNQRGGGGGGAGGMLYGTQVLLPGAVYTVTIGAGGTGAGGTCAQAQPAAGQGHYSSINGTIFGNLVAVGGGGGGMLCGATDLLYTPGGSGAGSWYGATPTRGAGYGYPGTAGSTQQGYPGGNAGPGIAVGGGGGAGGSGTNATGTAPASTAGSGGPGVFSTITGAPVLYAAGGGSGGGPSPAPFVVNPGLGGNPGNPRGGGAGGNPGGAPVNGAAAIANTGSAGGGGGWNNNTGGAGGSGAVILAIPTPSYSGVYGPAPAVAVSTPPAAPGQTILQFNGSGTYTS